ncbi:MAG: hypothetical protein M3405_14475 [Acidobacteriota bacterium]|jgi:hypothetical protein|nr:hypothetical protein [Acidobacteriota bacterium]
MRDFEIEQVSLNFRWDYERLIQSLPVVGTDSFGILCKKLAPFGIDASRIIAEAPTNKLGDAQMTIILLDGRLGIRFTISSFEIISDNFIDGDEQNIIDIADITFDALKHIDEDVTNGNANVKLNYHLKMQSNENLQMLSEHLNLSNDITELTPEAATYKIDLPENKNLNYATVVLANSLTYVDSIFLGITLDYLKLNDTEKFARNVTNDVVKIFNLLKLNGEILKD